MKLNDALDQMRAVTRDEALALDVLAASDTADTLTAVSSLWLCEGKVIVTGMGKCAHVGRKIAATFQSTGTPAAFLHPAEAAHGDMGMIGPKDVLLALSNSGETDELRPVMNYCQSHKIEVVAITSRPESWFAQTAKIAVILPTVREGCPIGKAPMASSIMMMAVGDAFAARLMTMRGFGADDFLALHHGGYLGRALSAVA